MRKIIPKHLIKVEAIKVKVKVKTKVRVLKEVIVIRIIVKIIRLKMIPRKEAEAEVEVKILIIRNKINIIISSKYNNSHLTSHIVLAITKLFQVAVDKFLIIAAVIKVARLIRKLIFGTEYRAVKRLLMFPLQIELSKNQIILQIIDDFFNFLNVS